MPLKLRYDFVHIILRYVIGFYLAKIFIFSKYIYYLANIWLQLYGILYFIFSSVY